MQFNDLRTKLDHAKQLEAMIDPTTKVQLYPNAQARTINAHGKFYGLRSKYDGKGNLREPMRASANA